jgi:hypothetical protein
LKKPIGETQVKEIILSSENNGENINALGKEVDSTDVIVLLKDNRRYIASFFSFGFISEKNLQADMSLDFLKGKYFWNKNMVLIKDCTPDLVGQVVNDLIDEGNFQEAFREL